MSRIKATDKVKGYNVLFCTSDEGDFTKAIDATIHSGEDSVKVAPIVVESNRSCFNNDPPAPIVMFKGTVLDKFLHIGNKVEFGY